MGYISFPQMIKIQYKIDVCEMNNDEQFGNDLLAKYSAQYFFLLIKSSNCWHLERLSSTEGVCPGQMSLPSGCRLNLPVLVVIMLLYKVTLHKFALKIEPKHHKVF